MPRQTCRAKASPAASPRLRCPHRNARGISPACPRLLETLSSDRENLYGRPRRQRNERSIDPPSLASSWGTPEEFGTAAERLPPARSCERDLRAAAGTP